MVKNLPGMQKTAYNAGDPGSIPELGRSPKRGEGNANPPQYSCLGDFMDRGVWQASVYAVAESDMTKHTHRSMKMSLGKQVNL